MNDDAIGTSSFSRMAKSNRRHARDDRVSEIGRRGGSETTTILYRSSKLTRPGRAHDTQVQAIQTVV
jgi:hypothetical protein